MKSYFNGNNIFEKYNSKHTEGDSKIRDENKSIKIPLD